GEDRLELLLLGEGVDLLGKRPLHAQISLRHVHERLVAALIGLARECRDAAYQLLASLALPRIPTSRIHPPSSMSVLLRCKVCSPWRTCRSAASTVAPGQTALFRDFSAQFPGPEGVRYLQR